MVFDPKVVSYEELLKTVLGEPRSDPGHAPGQRRRHPVPLGDLHHRRRSSAAAAEASRDAYAAALTRERARARSPPRSRRPASSISPRTTTSNIWPRTRAAIAGSAAPAWPAPFRRALRPGPETGNRQGAGAGQPRLVAGLAVAGALPYRFPIGQNSA